MDYPDDMSAKPRQEKRVSRTDTSASIADLVAPVAVTLDEHQETGPATNRDAKPPQWEVQQPRLAAHRSFHHKSWRSDGGQALSKEMDPEEHFRMSTASNPFSLQYIVPPTIPSLAGSTLRATQIDLVQQEEAAESKDCPFQRLQGKLRLHNSSDPRPTRLPSKQMAVDRGSIATVSSSSTDSSPRSSSRFSFGLLLQPSLELFKFSDIRTSLGGRGSGWSLWFKQDDASNGKLRHREMETK